MQGACRVHRVYTLSVDVCFLRGAHRLKILRVSMTSFQAVQFSMRHVKRTLTPSSPFSVPPGSASGADGCATITPSGMSPTGTCYHRIGSEGRGG